jgi:hypothetical protein
LFQPALKAPAPGTFRYSGLECLLLGWIGAFGKPQWVLPWSANLLFAVSLGSGIFRRQPGREVLLSLIAIPLALAALVNRTIEMDEAGNKTAVIAGAGFYLWLAGMLALAAAQLVRSEGKI